MRTDRQSEPKRRTAEKEIERVGIRVYLIMNLIEQNVYVYSKDESSVYNIEYSTDDGDHGQVVHHSSRSRFPYYGHCNIMGIGTIYYIHVCVCVYAFEIYFAPLFEPLSGNTHNIQYSGNPPFLNLECARVSKSSAARARIVQSYSVGGERGDRV